MSKEFLFFSYLVESYAQHKGISPAEALRLWNERGITGFIYDMYEMYHAEAIENAFVDIDSLIATGNPAW